jgi:galactosylgalactosylglucosylceramide beta-D-acetylgalactosaminyltransferase
MHHRHVPALLVIVSAGSLALGLIYLLWFTPLAVYVLDRLNLRPFFLPNIICTGCNNFTYRYMVDNRNFCSPSSGGRPVFLLILVASFHANLDARQAIRKSWGGVREYRGHIVRTLFVFGRHEDKNYNYQIEYELEHYGDVIQADFTDSYKWLTNKTMMALHWVIEYCPDAQFILKTDDDGFNVPQRFVDYLIGIHVDRFIGGYCFTVMPDRRADSKFYIPYTMYPDKYYPTYCSGPGYILSRLAVLDVISVANNVIFLPMEDVFVSGICRVGSSILYTQIVGVAEDQRQMTRCNLATWVKNGHNIYPQATPTLWQRVVEGDRRTDCLSKNSFVFIALLVFVAIWSRHVYYLIRSGLT